MPVIKKYFLPIACFALETNKVFANSTPQTINLFKVLTDAIHIQ